MNELLTPRHLIVAGLFRPFQRVPLQHSNRKVSADSGAREQELLAPSLRKNTPAYETKLLYAVPG